MMILLARDITRGLHVHADSQTLLKNNSWSLCLLKKISKRLNWRREKIYDVMELQAGL